MGIKKGWVEEPEIIEGGWNYWDEDGNGPYWCSSTYKWNSPSESIVTITCDKCLDYIKFSLYCITVDEFGLVGRCIKDLKDIGWAFYSNTIHKEIDGHKYHRNEERIECNVCAPENHRGKYVLNGKIYT